MPLDGQRHWPRRAAAAAAAAAVTAATAGAAAATAAAAAAAALVTAIAAVKTKICDTGEFKHSSGYMHASYTRAS